MKPDSLAEGLDYSTLRIGAEDGGKDDQRKLRRESKVLQGKVQRMDAGTNADFCVQGLD